MKTWAIAVCALLLAAPAAAEQQTRAPRVIHPALYVVRDHNSTIYLFGTIHVRPQGQPWGGPEAQSALASADEIWTELEISPEAEARSAPTAQQLGLAPANRQLSTWLTPEENQRLNAVTTQLGLPTGALERMQPWLASISLTIVTGMRAGYDPNSGVDRDIDAYGDAHHKTMRWFETAEQQFGFLAHLSDDQQHEILLDSIDESEKGAAMLQEMTDDWERGDVDALQKLVVDDTREDYPELYDVILRRRNAAWIPVIQQELRGSGVDFIAVGAGHLLGPDGLVALLRARGLHVERVRPQ